MSMYASDPCTGLDRHLGVEVPRISRKSAHEGGKAVRLTQQPSLPQEGIPGTYVCYSPSRPQRPQCGLSLKSK